MSKPSPESEVNLVCSWCGCALGTAVEETLRPTSHGMKATACRGTGGLVCKSCYPQSCTYHDPRLHTRLIFKNSEGALTCHNPEITRVLPPAEN